MRDVVWLLFLFTALAASLYHHAFPISLAAFAGLILAGSGSIWRTYALTGVRYSSELSHRRAEFGESVELRTEVVNAKLLPLAWITIEEPVPSGLPIGGATLKPGEKPGTATMVNALALLPFERVVRRFEVRCARRGSFSFDPARLSSGDPFGLVRTERTDGVVKKLTVYPKLRELHNLHPVAESLSGNRRMRRWYPDDPLAVAGVRAYRAGDPLHAIDWRVTARKTTLYVRELEATASPQIALFLHAAAPGALDANGDLPVLECAISFAASLVAASVERGWAVGLYAAPARASGLRIAIPPARGARQLIQSLERLAALEVSGNEAFGRLLEVEARRLPFGTTPCAIVVDPQGDDLAALAALSDRRPTIIFALDVDGSAERLSQRLLRARVVRVPFESDWSELDAVTVGF